MMPQALRSSASAEGARHKARALLTRFGVESFDHLRVEGFAAQLGVDLEEAPLDGARAQLVVWRDRDGDHARITLSERLTDPHERRFAIAHELGHFVLRHPAVPAGELCNPQSARAIVYREYELAADAFALELLMPAAIVREIHNTRPMTLDIPAQLAALCRVPLWAAAIRTTENTERICAAIMSERGAIVWIAPSPRFEQLFHRSLARTLTPGKRIHGQSLARTIRDVHGDSSPCSVPVRAWLHGRDGAGVLIEHSSALNDSHHVITMLWASANEARVQDRERSNPTLRIASEDETTTKQLAAPRFSPP